MSSADGVERVEHLGARSSYTYRLEAFAAAICTGAGLPYDVTESVPQAEIIDAAYLAAAMQPRP